MFRVHKTHDEWLVMSGDRTVCRCDFREDAEAIVRMALEVEKLWKEVEEWKQENWLLFQDQERLEWLVKNGWNVRFSRPNWRDAIDEAMEDE